MSTILTFLIITRLGLISFLPEMLSDIFDIFGLRNEGQIAILGALAGAMIGFFGSFLNEVFRDRRSRALRKSIAGASLVAFLSELSILLAESRSVGKDEVSGRYDALRDRVSDDSKTLFLETYVAINSEFSNLRKKGEQENLADAVYTDEIKKFVEKYEIKIKEKNKLF